jgi:hypothetical protein
LKQLFYPCDTLKVFNVNKKQSSQRKICCSNLPSKPIANAIDGIKPYSKRMINNVIF